MKTRVVAVGQIVVPKAPRERLGPAGGRAVEVCKRKGRLEIEPAPTPMNLVRRCGGSVAFPERKLPPLTDEIVRDAIEQLRR